MKAEVVEIYVPRRLEYLSSLYTWLRSQLEEAPHRALFRGFSLYEVSGAYSGQKLYTEQTLVIRLVFDIEQIGSNSDEDFDFLSYLAKLREIENEIVQITDNKEEEI